ncbi:MAG: 2-thiouracil desulfurase family protein [Thiomonas sp.]
MRYHGDRATCAHPILKRWLAEGRVVAVCPEIAGGLTTPRRPAEIETAKGGRLVLLGGADVFDSSGGSLQPISRSRVLEVGRPRFQ